MSELTAMRLQRELPSTKAAGLAATVDLTAAWGGGSVDYSVAYLAARFIDNQTVGGMSAFMDQLELGASLDGALATIGYASVAAFQTAFQGGIGARVTDPLLANADTGAVGGSDATAGVGPVLNASDVIDNTEVAQANPTAFNVVFPIKFYSNEGPTEYLDFQVGANEGEVIKIAYAAASTKSLGISDVNLRKEAGTAITKLDNAIIYISKQRARLGAQQNRLESAMNVNAIAVEALSASRSRIKDADYAIETAELTKSQILQQAATAMMGQSLANSSQVLNLLDQQFQ